MTDIEFERSIFEMRRQRQEERNRALAARVVQRMRDMRQAAEFEKKEKGEERVLALT